MRRRPPVPGRALARRPAAAAARRFAAGLLKPTRASVVRAALDGPVVAWTLRRRGLRRLLPGLAAGAHRDAERCRQVAAAVDDGLGILPMAPTCLRRSVTLARELRRLGLDGTVHLGVRHQGDRLEAHAWVQVGDQVVNDDPAVTGAYAELAAGELEALLPGLR